MPWKIVKDHSSCPDSKPWGVVKEDDGSVEGCHNTQVAAKKQQAALYASENNSHRVKTPFTPGPDEIHRSPWIEPDRIVAEAFDRFREEA